MHETLEELKAKEKPKVLKVRKVKKQPEYDL